MDPLVTGTLGQAISRGYSRRVYVDTVTATVTATIETAALRTPARTSVQTTVITVVGVPVVVGGMVTTLTMKLEEEGEEEGERGQRGTMKRMTASGTLVRNIGSTSARPSLGKASMSTLPAVRHSVTAAQEWADNVITTIGLSYAVAQ
jgi:hypothetical protein